MENIITSNYNKIVTQAIVDKKEKDNGFKSTLNDFNEQNNNPSNDELSYQNIKIMTLDDIQALYGSQEIMQNIRNRYIATQFSSDSNMSLTMFKHIEDMPYEQSTSFLANMFTQRNIYLNKDIDTLQKGSLLRQSIIDMIEDPDIKAEQEKLEKEFNTTMMKFNIMDYFNNILDFGKNESDKNKDSQYGFLFNNFYEQYSTLFREYKDTKDINEMIIQQY